MPPGWQTTIKGQAHGAVRTKMLSIASMLLEQQLHSLCNDFNGFKDGFLFALKDDEKEEIKRRKKENKKNETVFFEAANE